MSLDSKLIEFIHAPTQDQTFKLLFIVAWPFVLAHIFAVVYTKHLGDDFETFTYWYKQ